MIWSRTCLRKRFTAMPENKSKTTKIKKGTVRYEIEKVRLSVVKILLHAIKDGILTPAELKRIAQDVLDITDTVRKHAEIEDAVTELAKRYPLLLGVKAQVVESKR